MNRLVCSFSGGRTSAYMTWRVLREWRDRYDEITVLFANTGLEHEKTLEFVRNCDEQFGFNTVWLESVTHHTQGKGNTHRVVDFDSASRDGGPYYQFCKKYGIPNVAYPICTDRLKLAPMRSYIRDDLGHKRRDYAQVVGIRADEIDRMNENAMKEGVQYPLVRWGITKAYVLDWWSAQAFDLEIDEHLGNCVTCFKKTDRKLMTVARQIPEAFEPFQRIERDLKHCGPRYRKHGAISNFFRKDRTTADIIASSKDPAFVEWSPAKQKHQIDMFALDEMDVSNGCTESCEVDFI